MAVEEVADFGGVGDGDLRYGVEVVEGLQAFLERAAGEFAGYEGVDGDLAIDQQLGEVLGGAAYDDT